MRLCFGLLTEDERKACNAYCALGYESFRKGKEFKEAKTPIMQLSYESGRLLACEIQATGTILPEWPTSGDLPALEPDVIKKAARSAKVNLGDIQFKNVTFAPIYPGFPSREVFV